MTEYKIEDLRGFADEWLAVEKKARVLGYDFIADGILEGLRRELGCETNDAHLIDSLMRV